MAHDAQRELDRGAGRGLGRGAGWPSASRQPTASAGQPLRRAASAPLWPRDTWGPAWRCASARAVRAASSRRRGCSQSGNRRPSRSHQRGVPAAYGSRWMTATSSGRRLRRRAATNARMPSAGPSLAPASTTSTARRRGGCSRNIPAMASAAAGPVASTAPTAGSATQRSSHPASSSRGASVGAICSGPSSAPLTPAMRAAPAAAVSAVAPTANAWGPTRWPRSLRRARPHRRRVRPRDRAPARGASSAAVRMRRTGGASPSRLRGSGATTFCVARRGVSRRVGEGAPASSARARARAAPTIAVPTMAASTITRPPARASRACRACTSAS